MADTYTHGHHRSVLRNHAWRSAANSAAYLLDRLRPGLDLLDVGCGPGTITTDLARLVAPGRAVGCDVSPAVVAGADASRRSGGPSNAAYLVADGYRLPFGDSSFDVVHAHQLLQHLSDPVAALQETCRVLRPGGLLAVRDGDYGAFAWAPDSAGLDRWLQLYEAVARRNGGEPEAGRYLLGWVRRAGFVDATASSSTWTFADPSSRSWWGGSWAERVERSALAEQAVAYGMADPEELRRLARAWRRWAADEDSVFIAVHGEVLARKPG